MTKYREDILHFICDTLELAHFSYANTQMPRNLMQSIGDINQPCIWVANNADQKLQLVVGKLRWLYFLTDDLQTEVHVLSMETLET